MLIKTTKVIKEPVEINFKRRLIVINISKINSMQLITDKRVQALRIGQR